METSGMMAALLSSALGGTAIGATRYLAGPLDPVTIGAVRYGVGFTLLLGLALWRRDRWPPRRDWPAIILLGLVFFCAFPLLFNLSLAFTTAAHGALALSTVPLITMAMGAALGVERITTAKLVGVLLALCGVGLALSTGLATIPATAWKGDLIMIAAATCMSLYSVLSRPYVARLGPLPFVASGMGAGALVLLACAGLGGGLARLATLGPMQLVALAYLSLVCGALVFFLWAFALGRTTPTIVALSLAVNPITATTFGALLLDEPVGANVLLGLVAVILGIAVATGRLRWSRSAVGPSRKSDPGPSG